MSARWLTADVFDGLATLDDGSVDLVVTSPPFLALRSYLPADHPDKGKEIGSEATPAEFIDVMLRVTAELRRVLAPHGSICVELGDTYAGKSGADDETVVHRGPWKDRSIGQDESERRRQERNGYGGAEGHSDSIWRGGKGWPLAKSRTLIPQLYEIALAYGINPLTGQPSPAGQWRIRNVVTWARPNPPVGALGDKWRPATSDLIVACTSSKRYWDDLATRRPADPANKRPSVLKRESIPGRTDQVSIIANGGGAPLLDYWEIPPGGYKGSHYAVFPEELVVPLVKAMCPQKVCRTCGEPSRRIVGDTEYVNSKTGKPVTTLHFNGKRRQDGENHWDTAGQGDRAATAITSTLGWTDCGHDDYRPGLVLDPFAGSGTTLAVATGHGHDAIGIDLDERNAVLAEQGVGGFFFERADVRGQ